ncbi:hypothetical protein DDE18_01830 [Nocardioides gansuensis]|uniref:DUF4064 domain-containing protein n=1 Tax=Nocardioides gansuensis TaxID=2138300 RepID=A0A2T8FF90_9ACTN|nr:hypothetical protein [Nocardioides gansuensis]PVG84388.1 hypothetical protein DDE18_01830 [Nocardioides gansuensis]
MNKPTQQRPRQVTLAAGVIIAGSAFVVLSAWDSVSRMRSLETREAIERFLSEPPGSGLGIGVEAVIEMMHVAALTTAMCAAAATVLGWYALQGQRSARTALAILAVPLFLTGLVAGGFLSSVVAAACAMLWLSPAREWYAGRPLPTAPARDVPGPGPQGGQSPDQPPTLPSYPSPQGGSVLTQAPVASGTERRPDAVRSALVITVVSATIVLLLSLLGGVTLALSAEQVLDEMYRQSPQLREQGVDRDMVRNTSIVMTVVFVLASAGAILCAVAMGARKRWGARGLMVLSVATAAFSVMGAVGSLIALAPALAAVAVIALLRRPEVRAWFDSAPR